MEDDVLFLESPTGATTLPGRTLLIAVDETGHEAFADPSFRVFGLGGCAVMVRRYSSIIRNPWATMKAVSFGGADVPLHAADLGRAKDYQKAAIGRFFEGRQFVRFAALTTCAATIADPLTPYTAVAHVLMRQFERIAAMTECTQVALLFEESQRLRGKTIDFFSEMHLRVEENGQAYELPIHRFFGNKLLNEPILEVADCVAQTAGSAVGAAMRGKDSTTRRDFRAVFRSVPAHLAHYMLITGAAPRSGAA